MSFVHASGAQRRRLVVLILVSSLSLLVTSCTVAAPPKVSSWKNSTGAENFQRLFWQAVKEKDWLQVESHVASNFVYLDGTGNKDKPQTIDYLRSLDLKDFSLGEVTVTGQGADAIVTYTITLVGSKTAPTSRQMSLWQQQKSGWVLVAMSNIPADK